MENYPWWKLDQINKYSAYVETLSTWELQQCIEMIEKRRHRVTETVNGFVIANPGQGLGFHNFPEWEELKRLEAIVKAEIEKRQTPAPTAKPERKEKQPDTDPETLPTFEDMLRTPDRLEALYLHLEDSFEKIRTGETFCKTGYIGGKKRSAGYLYGLARGLNESNQMLGDYSPKDVYLALCRSLDIEPSTQLHKVAKGANFRDTLGFVRGYFD